MNRYIKADDLIDKLHKQFPNDRFYNDKYWDSNRVLRAIGDTPTADVRENTHGKWIRTPMACYGGGTITEFECSACGEHQIVESNFCPNCGDDKRTKDEVRRL